MSNLDQWLEIAPGLMPKAAAAYKLPNTEPPQDRVFKALELVGPEQVRVVILGQDPYHTPGKASGFAFGYHPQYRGHIDSSLANILLEVAASGYTTPTDITLEGWVKQGVLLINTRLTVRQGTPLSHSSIGWEYEIRKCLKFLAALHDKNLVWVGWGAEAHQLLDSVGVDGPNVIRTSHPCKFSNTKGRVPFTGSNCFSKVNEYLTRTLNQEGIQWHR